MRLRNGPLMEGREVHKYKLWIVFAFLAITSPPLIAPRLRPSWLPSSTAADWG
jgi:hypothetical protein